MSASRKRASNLTEFYIFRHAANMDKRELLVDVAERVVERVEAGQDLTADLITEVMNARMTHHRWLGKDPRFVGALVREVETRRKRS